GQTLGHYRVLEKIGAWGMGVVYRARDERLERDVALKVLPPGTLADEAARKRFRKEALALSQLNHPNIATVFDFDTQEGTDFLVMELIPGVTLNDKLAAGALLEKEITRLGTQLAQGLAAAHEQGVVHRDLKPGNLRITPDGRLKILDFGLATLRRPEGEGAATVSMTETATVPGTVPYMAPEQLQGEKADARSDIYAAGVVLYEMATGRRPFVETQGTQLVAAILQQTPPAPSAVNRKVSPGLEMIILKALDKEPERRYQSARELAVDLERLSVPTAPAMVGLAARRRRWPLAATAALVALGVLLYLLLSRGQAIDSLAVMPFSNAGGDPQAEYLSDGLTESLINSLSRLPRLRVVPRSTVFRYKGRDMDLQEAARALKVRAVLTGRVVQRGDTLNIQVELVDVSRESQLWGEQYNRKASDLLAVKEEIAREVSRLLRLRLTGAEQDRLVRPETDNSEAYKLYLQGRYHWNRRTPDSLQRSIEYFNQAIAKDRRYVLAYTGLADAYSMLNVYAVMPGRESQALGKAAAEKAVALDDTLAEAHVSLAFVKERFEWDWLGAEREYRRAMELNPNYPTAHHWYALMLAALGRGRHEPAIEQYRRTLEMDPNFLPPLREIGMPYLKAGRPQEGIGPLQKALALAPGDTFALGLLGHLYAASGKRAEALKVLERLHRLSREKYELSYELAVVYHGLGDKKQALSWLEKACESRSTWAAFLKVEPLFESLHSEPKFQQLIKRMGLAP
ncbi:MAG: protein kinase, partial [Acidobacteria bacterium]|nr:protein kinase [Acidobacteriota bacterium]